MVQEIPEGGGTAMDAITNLIPVPRPVRIEAAGVTVQAAELTLRDLADLQAALDEQWGDPVLEIRAALTEAERNGDEREACRLKREAYEKAEAGPPVYGEPSGRAYYATPVGLALLTWVALRRHQPTLPPGEAAALLVKMSSVEFDRLWRIAHGRRPLKTIAAMILPPTPGRGAPQTWGRVIEEIIEAHPGWTYRDVYDLTISEFANARRTGQPEAVTVPVPEDADIEAVAAEQRRRFYGPDEDQ
jgi:hypothetical protein